jgi:hypothetical protein
MKRALTAAAFSRELLVARDEKAYPHSMGKDWPPADAWVLVIT